jgi:hypothetical protein
VKLNRRHKAGLFITIVFVGLSLLARESLETAIGFFFLGIAASWAIGSASLRFCYALLIAASASAVVGALIVLLSITPTELATPIRYAFILIVPFLVSFLAFERRVWLRWHGKRLGLVSVPHQILANSSHVVTQEMHAAQEKTESYKAESLAQVAGVFNLAASLPHRISFSQAVNSRAEFADLVSPFSEPLPESVQSAVNEVYFAFTNEMKGVAQRSGMSKVFDRAEETNYNLHRMIHGKSAEEIHEPLANPISRPRVLALMQKYEHLGPKTDALLEEGLQYNRICEAIEPYYSPYRWIGGATGVAIGWWLDGATGAALGALVGQFGYPRLMRSLSVIRFLYRGRCLPPQRSAVSNE